MPDKVLDARLRDFAPDSTFGWCTCCCCSSTVFILVILFFPATVEQLGQHKLGLIKNSVTGVIDLEQTYYPGRYWIGFWKEFVEFPSTLQTIEFSNDESSSLGALSARDKAGEQVYLDITVQYQLIPELIGQVYKEFTVLYEDVYVSELRDALALAVTNIYISEAWTSYPQVNADLHSACEAKLLTRNAHCWGLQLWGVSATANYENQLVSTQVKKQLQNTLAAQLIYNTYREVTTTMLGDYDVAIAYIQNNGSAQVVGILGDASAQTEANLISAQAQILQEVKNIVVVQNADGTNTSMTPHQLVQYQQLSMLQAHPTAHFVYNLKGAQQLSSR